MNLQTAIDLYKKLESEITAQNFFTQAKARYVLFGVKETKFPNYRENLNLGSDSLAFSYLSVGCALFEKDYKEYDKNGKEMRRFALEKGAEFIEYNHFYEQNRNELSHYYLLVGALAYYASSQYSKAFVLMKKVNDGYKTDISILTSAFLKKDFNIVFTTLSNILLDEKTYITKDLEESEQTIDDRIQVVLYARALASLMDFLYFGNKESLEKTKEILADLLELLAIEREPSMWWVVRLFIIIVNGFEESSLWTTILPKISDNELATKFITNLIYAKNPVVELFIVQRKALAKVLLEKGAVVSLPTSSGKTRIAEIAILQCLAQNRDAKILYLAPFRSLAYEVENTLNQTFEKIGFVVSQLYGSGQFSQIDKAIIDESNILIATPEKAKVILRANEEIRSQIKLVIIDEGHLLDEQERQVRNELFIEEFKKYVQNNAGKIILLSAVLPNTKDISEWITQDREQNIEDNWRPASQLFGLLEYNKNNVDIRWQDKENSFNRSFLIPFGLKIQLKKKIKLTTFPSNIKEAIAYTASNFSNFGSVLIFIGGSNNVETTVMQYASNVKIAFQHNLKNIVNDYDINDWQLLELACIENEGENSQILDFAKYGIICHYGNLSQNIRLSLERLMRNKKVKVIISTTTLSAGVNLGISTVIIANYWISGSRISNRDFWNIAGRVGRAYTDTLGRILFAIDETQEKWQIDRNKKQALEYFKNQPENVESGFLTTLIKIVKGLSTYYQVDFDYLLQKITNDNFTEFDKNIEVEKNKSGESIFKNYKIELDNLFDGIDDSLLSIQLQFEQNPENIDDILRQTLAYIQAKEFEGLNQDNVIAFLKARLIAIDKQTANKDKKRLVSSGLPLASALKLDEVFEEIISHTSTYLASSKSIEDKIILLKEIEIIMKSMPSNAFNKNKFDENDIEKVRNLWLKGEPLSEGNAQKISSNYFAYTVSWFLGAVANRFKKVELEEETKVFEELAICCELGLPTWESAKVYLAGIRSRIASKEISETFSFYLDIANNTTISEIEFYIAENIDTLKSEIKNSITQQWLAIFEKNHKQLLAKSRQDTLNLPEELLNNLDIKSTRLFIRKLNDRIYLCSADFQEKIEILVNDNNENLLKISAYFELNEYGEWFFGRVNRE